MKTKRYLKKMVKALGKPETARVLCISSRYLNMLIAGRNPGKSLARIIKLQATL